MPIREIDPDVLAILKVGTNTVGRFKAKTELDKWKWTSGAWFPSGGFTMEFQSSGGVQNPSVVLTSYDFSTTTEVPTQKWSGSSLYEMKLNGALVGWFEAWVSGTSVKLMWWSNGDDLTHDRLDCGAGDVLAFIPGSLPTKAQRPLENPQISS